jgi:hypothetical protein
MVYVPIPIGSLGWGAPVNAAFTSQDGRITAIERQGALTLGALGFLAMPYDPAMAAAGGVLTSGTVYMIRLDLAAPATISTATICLVNAGVTLTAGQSFVGLYTAAGTRVALSADQSASWVTNGEKNIAFTAPYAAAAGTYYLAMLCNGTTPIAPLRTVSSASVTDVINHGLTPATARWTTGPTAQTSLPASVTMSSRVTSMTAYWGGLS